MVPSLSQRTGAAVSLTGVARWEDGSSRGVLMSGVSTRSGGAIPGWKERCRCGHLVPRVAARARRTITDALHGSMTDVARPRGVHAPPLSSRGVLHTATGSDAGRTVSGMPASRRQRLRLGSATSVCRELLAGSALNAHPVNGRSVSNGRAYLAWTARILPQWTGPASQLSWVTRLAAPQLHSQVVF